MKKILIVFVHFLFVFTSSAQLLLDADGDGNTYELITEKLAPGRNPIEVPDCKHTQFGRHIDEVYDSELDQYVFRFHIHTTEDDDRCINFDRQRNEIKGYDKSPDSLLSVEGETFVYKWKFKLDENFQSSPKFTHIHQLKAVGGSEASMPLITLTTRAESPDKLELRYARNTSQTTLHEVNLAPFKGNWCEVTERVFYGEQGTYSIKITKVSDGTTLFNYENDDIRMWKTDADFIRPKWGIYRSLEFAEQLRDEQVFFANFSIEENPDPLSSTKEVAREEINLFPNPTNGLIQIRGIDQDFSFEIYDTAGNKILDGVTSNRAIKVSRLNQGVFFLNILTNNEIVVKRFVKD